MPRRHSHFSALSGKHQDATRDAAMTLAHAGLDKPKWMIHAEDAWGKQGGAPNTQPIPDGRAGHRHELGAPAGTQNGAGIGTSPQDGVELMARNIVNQTRALNRAPATDATPGGSYDGKPAEDDPRFNPRTQGNRRRARRRRIPMPAGPAFNQRNWQNA